MVSTTESERPQHIIGVPDKVAIGKKQQFDDVPALAGAVDWIQS
jgi:hypothetical protein